MTVCGNKVSGVCAKCPYVKKCCRVIWERECKNGLCDNCSPKRWCSADKSRTECRYYQPMTNEEWFCQLPAEEKVNALLNLHERVRRKMRTDIGGENSFYKGEYYREWLKEKHE